MSHFTQRCDDSLTPDRVPGLVSVVVPAFNAERYVAAAIESVLAQTYRPIEVLVVNDGSTDGTETVLKRFGDAITVLTQDNRGLARARNRGFLAARGEFIAFLTEPRVFGCTG
jgi:glycosyltransferase involved in cell wall biosynthesis